MNSNSSSLLKPYYPALDGLRFFAFLGVFLLHYMEFVWPSPLFNWGWAGVDIFFVLSGFLITGILFDTLHQQNFFRNFYARRSLRIFPLFYAFWLALLLLTPVVHVQWNRYTLSMVAYLGNWFMASSAHASPAVVAYSSLHRPGVTNVLAVKHLWSLCVEEQFYLVWPLLVYLVRSRTKLLGLCVCVIFALPLVRALIAIREPAVLTNNLLYFSTWSRLDTLLAGAALALWLRGPAPKPATLRRAAYVAALGAPALFALCLWALPHRFPALSSDLITSSVGYSLVAVAAVGILLLTMSPETLPYRVFKARPFVYLGRISYGMYFFHLLPVVYFGGRSREWAARGWLLAGPLVAFAFTAVAASLSFFLLESPFLRLKSRLAPRRGAKEDPPPVRTIHALATPRGAKGLIPSTPSHG